MPGESQAGQALTHQTYLTYWVTRGDQIRVAWESEDILKVSCSDEQKGGYCELPARISWPGERPAGANTQWIALETYILSTGLSTVPAEQSAHALPM